MKRFTTEAVKARLLERLQQKEEWARILADSTISNVFDVIAEGFNENARYLEYCLNESKWENAQNMSSLTHMASLIGRKRRRPVSATGFVVVSHSDAEGMNRLQNFGSYFFSLDQSSDYDDISQNAAASVIEKRALVPWAYSDTYVVPKFTIFQSNSGIPFFSTTTVRNRQLKEPWSVIKRSDSKLEDFLLQGGWDGIKYVKVPVIQGVKRTVSIGRSNGERNETFVLDSRTVEDASNAISSPLFTVEIDGIQWTEIPAIALAGPYDYVFESYTTTEGVAFKFGDGNAGRVPLKNSVIWVNYVDTLGQKGNVVTKYSVTQMQFPSGFSQVDPRTGLQGQFLFCTNVTPLAGGKSEENEEDFKKNAPSSYLKSYTIGTTAAYSDAIMRNSPIGLLKMRLFQKSVITTENLAKSQDEKLVNKLTKSKSALAITAIKSDGEKIEEPKTTFLEPLSQALAEFKGPSDYMEFVQPNFIKMAANVTIRSSNLEISESEVSDYIKAALLDEYAIQNTDFGSPLYHSSLVERAACFPFSDSVSVFQEAIANTDYDKVKLYSQGNLESNFQAVIYQAFVAIPFYFDEVYGFTKGKTGFQNYLQSSQYLLRVDIKMPNIQQSRDRTLFLFDSRIQGQDYTVEQAKDFVIPGKPNQTRRLSVSDGAQDFIKLYNERNDDFNNRQVRVAQYPYSEMVYSDQNMYNVKSFERSPYEIRPLVVDGHGKNKEFVSLNVEQALREPIIAGASIGQSCYKKDINYYEGFDVIFYENYGKAGTADFAHGYIIVPMEYLGLGNVLASLDNVQTAMDVLPVILKDNVFIKVYAKPLITDIELDDPEDIVFIDDTDIRIEKIAIV